MVQVASSGGASGRGRGEASVERESVVPLACLLLLTPHAYIKAPATETKGGCGKSNFLNGKASDWHHHFSVTPVFYLFIY